MQTAELIGIYIHVLEAHGLTRPRSLGRRVYEQAVRFLRWCTENQVDPERYIRARHDAIKWKHRIPLDRLASPKFLIKFREWGDDKQAEEVSQDRLAAKAVRGERSRYLAEAVRRTMPPKLCRHDPWTWYDPESPTCTQCVERCDVRRG